MDLGMIGLGRMGANMVRRLLRDGHRCVAYDLNEAAIAAAEADGAVGARTLEELVGCLEPPRHLWVMVPAGVVDATLTRLVPLLAADDVVIDGGNSFYRDDITRAGRLRDRGVHYLDVGTSGGTHGLERGYCLMVGGETEVVARLAPILSSLAPGVGHVPRTPGRAGQPAPEETGWLHCGPSGAGHFVKMVHNGIEYGLMAAYAEGLNVLARAGAGLEDQVQSAEETPLRDPRAYQYRFDLAAITELWRRGSVVSSWLLDLTALALLADPSLEGYAGRVSDSGEGRWTVQAGVDVGAPTPVIAAALYQRFATRGHDDVAAKLLSAMRQAFGGHLEQPVAR